MTNPVIIPIAHGNYRVMRACCTSGNCVQCLARWDKSKRKIVMHMDGLSKKSAEAIAQNWRAYDATVEKERK
jgi:hypothetical protein